MHMKGHAPYLMTLFPTLFLHFLIIYLCYYWIEKLRGKWEIGKEKDICSLS